MAPIVVTPPAADAQQQQPLLIVLVSSRAVLTQPDDSLVLSPATIAISPETGKIISVVPQVLPASSFPAATTKYVDYSPLVLMPGLVDAHVHLNEPGRTEWEGFYTGTRAAASGGVTTVIDMPLNAIPPTTTVAGFQEKLKASRGQCWVDVGFYGGVVPGNAHELLPLVEAGVRGFKGFLIHSGVDEFPAVTSSDIELAMRTLKDANTTLMFHAEMLPPITDSVGDVVLHSEPPLAPHGHLNAYQTFLESRPPMFETCAIEEIVCLAPKAAPNLHLHIVHLSATECIPILRDARNRGLNITAETCFHYLGLAADDIPDGDTRHKCCPPIRSQINQDGLWQELGRPDSVIRTVVSDHSPCTPELKLLPGHLEPAPPSDGGRLAQVVNEAAFMRHSDSGVDMTINNDDDDAAAAAASKDDEATAKGLTPAQGSKALVAAEDEGVAVTPAEEEAEGSRGDFFAAWGGISSVGLGLSIMHTAAAARKALKERSADEAVQVDEMEDCECGHAHGDHDAAAVPVESLVPDIVDIVRLCCQATAKQVGLEHQKGGLRVGLDADICVFDDAMAWTLQASDMKWKNRCSPWEGHEFQGRVQSTWLRGQEIYTLGGAHMGFIGGKPVGKTLTEKRGVKA